MAPVATATRVKTRARLRKGIKGTRAATLYKANPAFNLGPPSHSVGLMFGGVDGEIKHVRTNRPDANAVQLTVFVDRRWSLSHAATARIR
ncbi:hypothetical protein GW17_00031596 [Ensete ventricosum]|nr:hypothetical protein GW17_00031596 [Ensete ventricosum]